MARVFFDIRPGITIVAVVYCKLEQGMGYSHVKLTPFGAVVSIDLERIDPELHGLVVQREAARALRAIQTGQGD